MPPQLFASPRFTLAALTSLASFISQGMTFVALPFLFQSVYGYSALNAALLFTAWWGRRHFRLPFPLRETAIVVLAGTVMGCALVPFRESTGVLVLAAQVTAGVLVYGIVLVALNFLGVRGLLRRELGADHA